MPRKGTWVALLLLAPVVLGLSWALIRKPAASKQATASAGPDAFGRDSQRFLPEELAPVYLGMPMRELVRARPFAQRLEKGDDEFFFTYDEGIASGRRVIYAVSKTDLRLTKVQVLSELASVQGIAPRIDRHQARFGPPSGVWDCPQLSDQLPTRRLSWTRGQVGVVDIYLLVGERVSTTLYVAPTSVVHESLARARCVRTKPEHFKTFPVPAPTVSDQQSPR